MKRQFVNQMANAFLKFFVITFSAHSFSAQHLTILPDGPDQMPVLFVHGIGSDGTGWGVGPTVVSPFLPIDLRIRYKNQQVEGPLRSPSHFFDQLDIPNWAVQWSAEGGNSPYASAAQGRAFLQTSTELKRGVDWISGTWSSHNFPRPTAMEVLLSTNILGVNTTNLTTPVSENFKILAPISAKSTIISQIKSVRNYQSVGRIEDRADNFLQMLSDERSTSGKLAGYRQINILTHSTGSLITRASLDKAEKKSKQDSEFVANVIYNAPPFAGSTMAYLANLLFEPASVQRSVFADPMVRRIIETHFLGEVTIYEIIDTIVKPLYESMGLTEGQFYRLLPPEALIIKDLFGGITLSDVGVNGAGINALNLLANDPFWGDRAADFLNGPLRTILVDMNGLPGMKELEPEGGAFHIANYRNNEDVKQFVALANGGTGLALFPRVSVDTIADNLAMLYDPSVLFTQEDDVGVAVGSAKFLTETKKFGPKMTLLSPVGETNGVFEGLTHEELWVDNVPAIAPAWMEALWVPPTRLELYGDVVEIDSTRRRYLVNDADTLISFDSREFIRDLSFDFPFPLDQRADVRLTIAADSHQYRTIADDGSSSVPSSWQSVALGANVSFRQIVSDNSLAGTPFFLEWRSINPKGGREMIRRARFTVANDTVVPPATTPGNIQGNRYVPQIIDYNIHAPISGEVIQHAAYNEFTDKLASQAESGWTIKNPNNKGLTLVLNKQGFVEYAWDDEVLSKADGEFEGTGGIIDLAGLSEGRHELYIRLSSDREKVKSKIIRFNIRVDNTPPTITFVKETTNVLGWVVGPNTPFYFTVGDAGSGSATSQALIAGQKKWSFYNGEIFTLKSSGYLDTLTAGTVGGFTDVVFKATDAVGNTKEETQQFYLDFTPPKQEIIDVIGELTTGGLIDGENKYKTASGTVQLVVSRTDNGAGAIENPKLFSAESGGSDAFLGELVLAAVTSYPLHYGIEINLREGINNLSLSSKDVVGNTSVLNLEIDYVSAEASSNVDVLSPRVETCFNADGTVTACGAIGNISNIASSYYGDTVAFVSSGKQFVAGDYNNEQDVFVYRNNKIELVSLTKEGLQGNDRSDFPQVSGNGRYVVFQSSSTNLAANTENTGNFPQYNLFIKDLDTGKIAVITRQPDKTPANLTGSSFNYYPAVTFTGRYVFFSTRVNRFVNNIKSPDSFEKIYMVDLDPDANGDYFDDNYQNHAVSFENDTTMLAGKILQANVSQDGKYLAFQSGTNAVASAAGIVLFTFAGNDADGTLDVSQRESVFIARGSLPRISPDGAHVAFITRRNLTTDDTNKELVDTDVYLSSNTTFANRELTLLSKGYDGKASAGNGGYVVKYLSISEDGAEGGDVKVSWVSQHNNIVADDINNVEDFFVYRKSTAYPDGLLVPNWISNNSPSEGNAGLAGLLTQSGRYALWSSRQTYTTPFSADGDTSIYRRRIDPVVETILDVSVEGDGVVQRYPTGVEKTNTTFAYNDTDEVMLMAQANENSIFVGWSGSDSRSSKLYLKMNEAQNITAQFEVVLAPTSASLSINAKTSIETEGVMPEIQGEAGQLYLLRIESPAENGRVRISNGRFFYKSNEGYVGNDRFTFQVSNQYGQSLPVAATASVTVVEVNAAPTLAEFNIGVEKNTVTEAMLPVVTDSTENETFTYKILVAPINGSVELSSSGFVYTPAVDFIGNDSFLYQLIDSANNTLSATARVSVIEKNLEDVDNIEDPNDVNSTPPEKNDSGKSSGGKIILPELLIAFMLLIFIRYWRRALFIK